MKIIGEYSIEYNIFTMFDVYTVKIKNHNLITNEGYEFFLKKWYTEEEHYPVVLGYYYNNGFYAKHGVDDTYYDDLKGSGTYSKTTTYIDKNTYKQYKFDGENFVGFYEKLDSVCIGNGDYRLEPSENDTKLFSLTHEYKIDRDEFVANSHKLIMTYEVNSDELNGSTEIGVKTNHGRLVSHDVHLPYNLPFSSNVTLEYVFKL